MKYNMFLQKRIFLLCFHSKNVNHLDGRDALDVYAMKNVVKINVSGKTHARIEEIQEFFGRNIHFPYVFHSKNKKNAKTYKKHMNPKTLLVSSKHLGLPELNGVRRAWERPTRSLVVRVFEVFEIFVMKNIREII